jgi:outer membrane lipoprotein carrier protein
VIPAHGLAATLLAAGLTLVAAAGAGAGGEPSRDRGPAAAWTEHLRRCLAGAHSLSARFTQELLHPLGVRGETRTGHLELRRGGRLRLEYDPPAGGRVISDGKTVRSFDPTSRLLVEEPAHRTPMALALDFAIGGDLETGLEVAFLGGAAAPGRNGGPAVLSLRPKQPRPPLERVALVLEPTCPCVRRAVLADGSGVAIRLSFEDVRVNPGLGRRRFLLEPFPGVEVVRP